MRWFMGGLLEMIGKMGQRDREGRNEEKQLF